MRRQQSNSSDPIRAARRGAGTRRMRVFCASIATESNTFSPLRTSLVDFKRSHYFPPGKHPDVPTLCSAVFTELRRFAAKEKFELIEGTAAWAEPGGIVSAETWDCLLREVLGQLSEALPVDAVVLGLHGAMIADNCLDCEGELVAEIRKTAGPKAVVGITLDPHSHLSAQCLENTDVITVFKEFPHTDFVEAAEACVDLTLRAARGWINPVVSQFDVRMIDVMPTSREPMRSFVDKMVKLEVDGSALSVSAIHGFMAGDSPDLGARIIVVTDNAPERGDRLAKELGMELFSFRGSTMPELLTPEDALSRAEKLSRNAKGPVVISDIWDNPGGGVGGDSTVLAEEARRLRLTNLAIGSIWDPKAVRLCHLAGEGAVFDLRLGGKISSNAGRPIDARVKVMRLGRDIVQGFRGSLVPLGDCAVVWIDGIEIVLNSNRSQAFSPDLFTKLGIDVFKKKILIVKSTHHFYDAFAPVASQILYADVKGIYPSDPRTNNYKNLKRRIWPLVENPHAQTFP